MISDELKQSPDRFSELAQFLNDPDIEVRGFAAVWLQNLMPEQILPILKEINKTEKFGTAGRHTGLYRDPRTSNR